MNGRLRRALVNFAAEAEDSARDCERSAANVGDPHHSHLLSQAKSWKEAATEARALLGLGPDERLPLGGETW